MHIVLVYWAKTHKQLLTCPLPLIRLEQYCRLWSHQPARVLWCCGVTIGAIQPLIRIATSAEPSRSPSTVCSLHIPTSEPSSVPVPYHIEVSSIGLLVLRGRPCMAFSWVWIKITAFCKFGLALQRRAATVVTNLWSGKSSK